jgi:RNA polymerase sigma-70 factor, ECF subfamily
MDRMSVHHDCLLEHIESLYRARFGDFLRVAIATAGSTELGRDAVHDAFVTAIRQRDQYRGEGPVEAWLWRVVVTSALKARRSFNGVSLRQAPADEASNSGPSDDLHEVREAVSLLPERQRTVLFLRYYADLDYQTIADVLNVRPGTVAAALNAAHGALRRRIQEVPAYD